MDGNHPITWGKNSNMKKAIIHITLLLSAVYTHAQEAVTNKGGLQVHAGTSMYCFGDFSNNSAGALVNNGSLYILGTTTNDQASMSTGTGTLYLVGSSSQSVNGTQSFNTYNFVSDNTAGIVLNNNLSVSGAHTFTNGMITTSATPNYLVYEAGSTYSGTSDSRHVNGWVKKNGNNNFAFPVGDASFLRSAQIASLSASSEINCHYYRPTQNPFNLSSPLVQVKANEYWQIDKVSGGTAQITLNWDNSKVAMDNVLVADIVVAHYTGGNWTDAGGTASGNILTTGTAVTSNSLSSFSPFTLGYKSFPVPVTLISFTAERNYGTTHVKWITENEQGVDHYEIQKSYNATTFSTIGNTAGRNTGNRELYNYDDHSALQGVAYYRLRSADRDGKYNYSKIVAVFENDQSASGFIIMNPVRTVITIINKTKEEGPFSYALFSSSGQLMLKGNVSMGINGSVVLPLPAPIASGVYTLELSNRNIRYSQKILVGK
jgi:hypothetical protein